MLILGALLVSAAVSTPTAREAFDAMSGPGGETDAVALDNGAEAWAARWRVLAHAKRTIHSSYFIVSNDVFGMAFIAHLYMRAMDGVEVKLLLDGRGSGALSLPFMGLDELQELVGTGNAEVRVYNPPFLQIFESIINLNAVPMSASTHTKILVADDELAVAGGRNIGSEYFTRRTETGIPVADTDVMLVGGEPVAALDEAMQHEFDRWGAESIHRDVINLDRRDAYLRMIYYAMDAWLSGAIPDEAPSAAARQLETTVLARFSEPPPEGTRNEVRPYLRRLAKLRSVRGALAHPAPHTTAIEARVMVAKSRAEKVDDTANIAIIEALSSAQHRVWMQSPYLSLTPQLYAALEQASDRGVEIVALTNGPTSSDNDASQALFIDSWPELEASIPTLRVFVSLRDMLHTKRVIIDDDITLVGSHNLDPVSSHLNSEVVIALWSRSMNADAAGHFEAAVEGGEVLEYRVRRPPGGNVARDGAGAPVVELGPAQHVSQKKLQSLRDLKEFLFSIRNIVDFEYVAW